MKKALIIACTMAFVSAAAFAQAPSVAPLSSEVLAAILGQPEVAGSCPTPQGEALFAARRQGNGLYKSCSATANCWDGTTKSCTWSGAGGTCTATDSNCDAGIRGSVNCNGTVTSCLQCPCGTPMCCQCASSGDCFACCRCDGGTVRQCGEECGF
jgi:hypothetical protein